jgi:starch phosphorylase
MSEDKNWFKSFRRTHLYKTLSNHPIAYFCAEYALDYDMPTYAGGLGVLAGDFVREAFDQKIPVVGVGLYYHKGYTRQKLYTQKRLDYIQDPANLGLSLVRDKTTNKPILIKVPIQNKDVFAVAWLCNNKTAPVYLLDTNISENNNGDKLITENLYDADLQTRLKQEIVLGIGGYRILQTLGIQPSIYHMNEGHSAFLALEVISNIMRTMSISFEEAREIAKKNIVFTNHTLVAAGHDNFVNDLVSLLLERYAQQIQVPVSQLVSKGLVKNSDIFSMTMLSLRCSGGANAVSKLHAEKAASVWSNHPMIDITNGIHIPFWDMISNESELYKSHQKNKKELLAVINKTCKQKWKEDELLIGWARRVVGYKRPLAIFSDIQRIKKIATNKEKPVNIFFAGLYHSDDQEGIVAVNTIKKLASKELKGNLAFVDDYNTNLAKSLTSGADIWLNTPVVGFEACGTSGMKAALNGTLNFSTKDGWFYEVDSDEIGWEINDRNIKSSIYDILEWEIVPAYYDEGRVTELWRNKMKNARKLALENFSATRMLKDYIEKIYSKLI